MPAWIELPRERVGVRIRLDIAAERASLMIPRIRAVAALLSKELATTVRRGR